MKELLSRILRRGDKHENQIRVDIRRRETTAAGSGARGVEK
jgi:hypothetical protein